MELTRSSAASSRLSGAVMKVAEVSKFEAIRSVASTLGIAEESVRWWRHKAQVGAGQHPGMTDWGLLHVGLEDGG